MTQATELARQMIKAHRPDLSAQELSAELAVFLYHGLAAANEAAQHAGQPLSKPACLAYLQEIGQCIVAAGSAWAAKLATLAATATTHSHLAQLQALDLVNQPEEGLHLFNGAATVH